MVDVQLENGYTRIANALYDEILKRDFSKRQLKILLFIMRYSYGFSQKSCVFEHLSDFQQAGLDRTDIKKELNILALARVILWDKENNIFQLNKNFEEWQISNHKYFCLEKISMLVNYLRRCMQNTNNDVGKIPTPMLVNYQQGEAGNTGGARDVDLPKESKEIKENIHTHGEQENKFFGEFKQVRLTEQEYQDFIGRCLSKDRADKLISELDENLQSGSDFVKFGGHLARLQTYLRQDKKRTSSYGKGNNNHSPPPAAITNPVTNILR